MIIGYAIAVPTGIITAEITKAQMGKTGLPTREGTSGWCYCVLPLVRRACKSLKPAFLPPESVIFRPSKSAHVCIQEVEQLDGMVLFDRHHGISLDHGSQNQLVGMW